jgi:hypothetical protein
MFILVCCTRGGAKPSKALTNGSETQVAWLLEAGVNTPFAARRRSGNDRANRERSRHLTEHVMQSQCGDLRRFASSAERPGSGSPRTIMFGVHSAVHADSRSAKTSSGTARRAIAYSSSVVSKLQR